MLDDSFGISLGKSFEYESDLEIESMMQFFEEKNFDPFDSNFSQKELKSSNNCYT